jgi:hypothetical protein
MAIKIITLIILVFLNPIKLFSQYNLLSEDSLFSFIKVKTDSVIATNYPNLNNYKVKMSFTINVEGKLKVFSLSPQNVEYVNLNKKIKQIFCKLKYKDIYNYLHNISEFRNKDNVIFEIVYQYNK